MKTRVLSALALAVLISAAAAGQEKTNKFGLEISGGPSFATRKFTDGLKPGIGYDVTLHYRFMPHTGIYAGWGENWLSSEAASEENNQDFEERGYVLGIQFKHSLSQGSLSPFIRAGALFSRIDAEDDNGNITGYKGHGPGIQLAGGIDINLGNSWSLTPVVKYNSVLRYLDSEGESMDLKYSYLTVRVGILKSF